MDAKDFVANYEVKTKGYGSSIYDGQDPNENGWYDIMIVKVDNTIYCYYPYFKSLKSWMPRGIKYGTISDMICFLEEYYEVREKNQNKILRKFMNIIQL